jgi:hypothetical protein
MMLQTTIDSPMTSRPACFRDYTQSCNRIVNKYQQLVLIAPQYAGAFVVGVEKALDELLREHPFTPLIGLRANHPPPLARSRRRRRRTL